MDYFKQIDPKERAFLVEAYSQPWRDYHDLAHPMSLIDKYELFQPLIFNKTNGDDYFMYRTIWYHDVIYDPTAHDNEECSAARFISSVEQFRNLIDDQINATILLSKRHVFDEDIWPDITGRDYRERATFFLSLDLSGFAESSEVVISNGRKVRNEYKFVNDHDFVQGRAVQFLEQFKLRDPFFPHPFFEKIWRDKALRNIDLEIAHWKQLI